MRWRVSLITGIEVGDPDVHVDGMARAMAPTSTTGKRAACRRRCRMTS